MAKRKHHLEGQKFKNFTALELSEEKSKRGTRKWRCQCICGNIRFILASELKREKGQKSCGCISRQNMREERTTHGMSKTLLYGRWVGMKARCLNPKSTNYKDYGGRGIKICEAWLKFEGFMEWSLANGYNDELSIDRINGEGNYEPENCRWTTKEVQSNNRRTSTILSYKGENLPIKLWAERTGIARGTLAARVRVGWSIEDSLSIPTDKKNKGFRQDKRA
ncbi:hypothetical protein ACSFXN_10955 [Planococcus sp. 1R117A]|uniref:hypothetical protein n=1 Tax=Planococcus sp. 1R117A TaxID=3447020 RepID=UPI003EDBAFE1